MRAKIKYIKLPFCYNTSNYQLSLLPVIKTEFLWNEVLLLPIVACLPQHCCKQPFSECIFTALATSPRLLHSPAISGLRD